MDPYLPHHGTIPTSFFFTDRFNRRADVFAATDAEFTIQAPPASSSTVTFLSEYAPSPSFPATDSSVSLTPTRSLYERLGIT